MGRRGPPPTPTPILRARGSDLLTDRKGERTLPVERPTCPAWFGKEARAEWGRQCAQLTRLGVLAKIDRGALALWCEAWAEFTRISRVIDHRCRPVEQGGLGEEGYAVVVAAGLVNVKNKAAERMLRVAAQFGFTPSARTRLQAPPEEAEKDAFEEFLNRGKGSRAG